MRGFDLPTASGTDFFGDDEQSLFAVEINSLASAGVTLGCNPPANDRFCPHSSVSRAEMATFIWRAFGRPAPGPAARIVAAGDIAECDLTNDEATASLLDQLFADTDGVVAALGDTVYPDGSAQHYEDCYEPSWGRHRFRTRPAVGNHEYRTTGAAGYFNYFGTAAGNPDEGWYAYTVGAWHVVVLNSNCDEIGGCDVGSAQEQWLRRELDANPAQ